MANIVNIVNNTNKGFFKTFIPLDRENGLTKIYEKKVGDKVVKYLRGQATNNQADKEDDRISKSFIAKIKQNALGLNVFAEHEHTIEKTLGYIDAASGDDSMAVLDTALEPEDQNDLVKKIIQKINHGINIGYSIGGKITKCHRTFDETLKKTINEIDDGEIYEVSLTAMPAGNDTWVTPISKSLHELFGESEIQKQLDDIDTDVNKALTHNSKLADSEPAWGTVNKSDLPRQAFADKGTPGEKSTWKYPHHWVSNGTMYLHKGGLAAAWAAANGARSGQQASDAVKAHLQAHRKALGLTEKQLDYLTVKFFDAKGIKPDEYDNMMKTFNAFEIFNTLEKELENIDNDNTNNLTAEDFVKKFTKALDEMVQANKIQNDMWDIFYSYRQAIYTIVESEELTPADKSTKIKALSVEFADKIEQFAAEYSQLMEAIDSQLEGTETPDSSSTVVVSQ